MLQDDFVEMMPLKQAVAPRVKDWQNAARALVLKEAVFLGIHHKVTYLRIPSAGC